MSAVLANRVTESPWWGDWKVARILHAAAANGAEIANLTEYAASAWGDLHDEEHEDPWFLNVDFGTNARVVVRYTTDAGCWSLEIDTEPVAYNDIATQLATSLAIGHAAKLCRDLNTLVDRQQRRERTRERLADVLSEEIEALMGDRGLTPNDVAAHLAVSNGVLASKLSGSTGWRVDEVLKLARLFDRDDPVKTLVRLFEATDLAAN